MHLPITIHFDQLTYGQLEHLKKEIECQQKELDDLANIHRHKLPQDPTPAEELEAIQAIVQTTALSKTQAVNIVEHIQTRRNSSAH